MFDSGFFGIEVTICEGCGNEITGRLDEHREYCRLWHMKQVLNKKNESKPKKRKPSK